MRYLWRPLVNDLAACLGRLERVPRPMVGMFVVVGSMAVAWFIYVPIHELLHAGGCAVTGGMVTELEIAPQYGGAILARWIPFVVAGGENAGRLSGFDTKGSDLVYLATVFAPYLLTVLFGVPMIRLCTRRWRPMLAGAGVVVGLAPFYNIFGDYYEMGSIVATRVTTWMKGQQVGVAFKSLRSDDVFKTIEDLARRPETLGLPEGGVAAAWLIVTLGILVGVLAAFVTYLLGAAVARMVVGRTPPPDVEPAAQSD